MYWTRTEQIMENMFIFAYSSNFSSLEKNRWMTDKKSIFFFEEDKMTLNIFFYYTRKLHSIKNQTLDFSKSWKKHIPLKG